MTLPSTPKVHPLPALSPTMKMGTIAAWNCAVGEEITAGMVFCEIETDKATVDMECQEDCAASRPPAR